MFSFGIKVYRENENIVFEDELSNVTLKLYYDELLESQILLSAINSGKTSNINTKLSTKTTVIISRTKDHISLTIGGMELVLTIGQSKSVEYLMSKLLTFWPLVVLQTPVLKQKTMLTEVEKDIEPQQRIVPKDLEEKVNTKTEINNIQNDDILELTSAIVSLRDDIDEKSAKQLIDEINKTLNTNYPFSYNVIKTIVSTTKNIMKDKDIKPEQYRNTEYEKTYPILANLWKSVQEKTAEQDRRLLIACYYLIQQIIEVNDLLGGI